MKITFICAKFPPIGGGPGVAAFHLAKKLSEDHEVTIVTERYPNTEKIEHVHNFTVKRVTSPLKKTNPLHFIFLALKLAQQTKGADIIHIHDVASLAGFFLKKPTTKAKTVFKYGGDAVYESLSMFSPKNWDPAKGDKAAWNYNILTKILFNIQRRIINKFDIIYANCQYGYNLLKNDMRVPESKLAIVHNATDIDLFNPKNFNKTKIKTELKIKGKLVLAASRLMPWKGNGVLIDAFKELNPNATLVIAGDGSEKNKLKQKAAGNIIITGNLNREQILKYMAAADVFAFPSFFDWGPNSLQEAMAMEKVCIATNVGGVPEMINSKNGFLIEKKDTEALKNALKKALSLTAAQSKSIGSAARKTVLESYSKEANFVKIMEIYKKCL